MEPAKIRGVPPLTELAAMANATHELFLAYVDAGFTESQAMQLVCARVAASAKPNA